MKKKKNWILFRTGVYFSFSIALLVFCLSAYVVIEDGLPKGDDTGFIALIFAITLSQLTFQFMNGKLLHHFYPNSVVPGPGLGIVHTVLLVINLASTVFCSYLLILGIMEVTHNNSYQNGSNFPLQVFLLTLLAVNIAAGFYTAVASLKLRNYLLAQHKVAEDFLLNSIGSEGNTP